MFCAVTLWDISFDLQYFINLVCFAFQTAFSRKAQTTDSVDGTAEDQDTGDDDAKSNEAGGKIGYFAAAFKTSMSANNHKCIVLKCHKW